MALVRIFLNDTLINDANAIYAVYFSDAGGNLFGTSSAIIVEDDGNIAQSGSVSGGQEISFDFDYVNNNQGGRTPNTDADIVVVGTGLNEAKYTQTAGTITNDPEVTFVLSAIEEN